METNEKKKYVAPAVTAIVFMEQAVMQAATGTATGDDPEFTEDAKGVSKTLFELIYDL